MSRPILSLALLLALAAAIAPLPAFAQDRERLVVLLDWFVNPDHVPLVVARERGYFAEEGLAVELVPPADPSAPPRLVATGQADVAISYQPNLYQQVAKGLPIARVGTLVATPLNSLVTLADGAVQSIPDLKGRVVGYSVGGFEDALLGTMLEAHGLTLDDVSLVNVNFALTPALLSQRVSAVIGAFRNFELNQIALEGREGRAFYPEEHGVPVYDELIFIARREDVEREALAGFLRAVERATLWQVNHPDEALALFLEAYPDLDNALNRRAFRDTLPRFALRPFALDRGRYERFAAFMLETGLVSELPPLDTYAVELR